jgi:hypothetical protein
MAPGERGLKLDVPEAEWRRTLAKAVRDGDIYWVSRVFDMAKEAGSSLAELANMQTGGQARPIPPEQHPAAITGVSE